jgi:hypothetical protein
MAGKLRLILPAVCALCFIAYIEPFAGGFPEIFERIPETKETAPADEIKAEPEERLEPEFKEEPEALPDFPEAGGEFSAPGEEPAAPEKRTGRIWIPAVLLGAAAAGIIFMKLLKGGL